MSLPIMLLLGVVALSQQPPRATEAPGKPADLWIDAVVLDRQGVPLLDIRPGELEVWIGSYRIPILEVSAVTPEARGRTVVLLLDDRAIDPASALRVKETARAFVNEMGPGDRMAIVPLHGSPTTLTDERARLLQAISSYSVQGLPFRIEDAGAHVLQTVARLSRALAEEAPGRKALVALGAGWMFDTPLPPPGLRDLRSEWLEAMRATAAAHVSLYVVDPAGLGMRPGFTGGRNGFARETGGHAFLNTNDLHGAAARVWQEAGSYYLIGVSNPAVHRSAELRELDVRVLRKGTSVRARRAIPAP